MDMMRSVLIFLSKAAWAQRMVMGWSFAWRTASRFVAGTKLEDALRVVRELNARGINATLDHLGEHTSTPEEAQQATDDIFLTLDALGADPSARATCARKTLKGSLPAHGKAKPSSESISKIHLTRTRP
jgi:proline dehydrogenase